MNNLIDVPRFAQLISIGGKLHSLDPKGRVWRYTEHDGDREHAEGGGYWERLPTCGRHLKKYADEDE